MKNIKIKKQTIKSKDMKRDMKFCTWLILLCSFVFLTACENDWDKMTVQSIAAPADVVVNTTEPFVCTIDNAEEIAFTFSWTKADFGNNVPVSYVLQFDMDENFAEPAELVAGSNITQKDILSGELNPIMHALKQPIDVSKTIYVRVKARPMVLGSATPQVETMFSASSATVYLTSYAMPPLHFVGSMFGAWGADPKAWDINNYSYVMFRDNPLGVDLYVANFQGFNTTDYAGQTAFVRDADLGNWGATVRGESPGKLKNDGDNIEDITETGYYTFTVDLTKMTYSITPYDVSGATVYAGIELAGVGDAPVLLTQAFNNPHIWEADNIALEASQEVRFQANGSSTSWGSNTFPWGTGQTTGEDISIGRTGNYFIKFNDLTGHYVFYFRK